MAASILQSSFLPSLCSSSSSSSSSTKLPTNFNTKSPVLVKRSPLQRLSHHHHQSKRNLVLNSTTFEAPVLDDFLPTSETSKLKFKLLSTVSGLNRGLAADENDLEKANTAAKELEAVGGLVDFSESLDKLQGRWKLIYSSAFSSRTLGGSRPGPPIGRLLPITLGQVFQRIDIYSKDFDNIVELQLGTPWPLPPVEVKATLAHKFELVGSSRIKIVYQKTMVKTTGNLAQLPPLEIPQLPEGLRPSSNRGTGDFDVTYQDADTRLTRGDRGELRVFVIA